jgi:hypothetical protein
VTDGRPSVEEYDNISDIYTTKKVPAVVSEFSIEQNNY